MHAGFDKLMIKEISRLGLEAPTPIQAQSLPVALSGRDMIGVAKTGSGKTFAYIWPMVVHIMAQRELSKGEGPIGLVLAPTRELAQQIYTQGKRFTRLYNGKCVPVYGGAGKWEQAKMLADGAELCVATPGRLIEHVKKKNTNMRRLV